MKFTPKTVQTLKHFSSINPSIVIKKGDVITTTSQLYTIVARTTVDQTFDHMIPIYDLNRFLGALSLFDDPEIQCHENYMTIRSADKELNYLFADPKAIKTPSGNYTIPEGVAELKLTASILSDTMKALNVMSLPVIAFVGDGEKVSIQAIDPKNPTSDNFKIGNLGPTDKKFKAYVRVENMKIIMADYDLTICKKLVHLKGSDIEYWIAVEKDSEF